MSPLRWQKKFSRYSILFIILFYPFIFSYPEEKIKKVEWHTEVWSGLTDDTGIYTIVIKEIFKRAKIELVKKNRPHKRALMALSRGEIDLAGARPHSEPGTLTTSYPILEAVIAVTYPKTSFIKSFQKDHKSIRLVSTPRMLTPLRKTKIDFKSYYEVRHREQAIKMLLNKRVDAYLDAEFEIKRNFEISKTDISQFNIEILLSKKYYMLVPDNKRGQKVKDIFDTGIKQLFKEKFIEKLYNKKGFASPHFTIN